MAYFYHRYIGGSRLSCHFTAFCLCQQQPSRPTLGGLDLIQFSPMALTPILSLINNEPVQDICHRHLAEYMSERKCRRQSNDWRALWRSDLEHNTSFVRDFLPRRYVPQCLQIPIIQDWLAKSIGMEVENLLHVKDTLDVFIEVQIFLLLEQEASALQILCNVQKKIEKLCVSTSYWK